jgi:FtsP/CotA-like multicopper oxidase with cupredoxin domain
VRLVPRSDRGRLLLAIGATAAILLPIGWFWQASLVPDTYDIAEMGYADYGGGPRSGHGHGHGQAVADLVADPDLTADVRVTLTARRDGDRYTVNGTTPGPTIRAVQGDLVEVTLENDNVKDGTTLHWHGVEVPNAMDGVAGVTQDAVGPGESYVYRFVAEQPGTYWYHSHQVSHEQVREGLLGALVIEPRGGLPEEKEALAVLHRYRSDSTVNGERQTQTVAASPGELVRVRVINTDNALVPVWVTGAGFRVLAVDGRDLNGPGEVRDKTVVVTAGGRVDLGVVVPEGGARVDFGGDAALVLGEDPGGGETPDQPESFLDLLSYGEPADPGFDSSAPDRRFDYSIGRRIGFLDGKPGRWWTVNGHLFPDVPMFMVEEGDVVVFRIENHSGETHPMHLHGHHALVLSRDGQKASGSPWWVDSLEVGTNQEFEIAFLADNPGIWMDHCHNLPHASEGLTAHVMYAGIESSFEIGGDDDNHPE